MRYQDLSKWMDEEGYFLPDSYQVRITLPANCGEKDVTVSREKITILSEEELGPLKDGLYQFEVESCGVGYTKYKVLYPKLRCCLDRATVLHQSDPTMRHRIYEVEQFIALSDAAGALGNYTAAGQNFKIAERMFENIKCDCNC